MYTENTKKELTTFFFSLRNTLYYYHLSTHIYSRHVASGTLVHKFDELIDNFLEILYGKYDRPDTINEIDIKIKKQTNSEAYMLLQEYIEYLNNIDNMLNPNDTDLLNIRDEMNGLLNNNKYLFLLR